MKGMKQMHFWIDEDVHRYYKQRALDNNSTIKIEATVALIAHMEANNASR